MRSQIGDNNGPSITDPVDKISDARLAINFSSFVTGEMAYHSSLDGMTADQAAGLTQILSDARNRLEWSQKALSSENQRNELDILRRAGLPEEAFRDEDMRRVWRSGFSHGLNSELKEPV